MQFHLKCHEEHNIKLRCKKYESKPEIIFMAEWDSFEFLALLHPTFIVSHHS